MTRARMCGMKTPHPTKTDAENHLWSLIRSGTKPGAMSVYHCPYCGAWHVGHRKHLRR